MWSNVLVLFRWRCAQGLLLSWPYSSMFETSLSNTNYVLIFFSCKRSRVREYSKLWVRIQIIRHGFFGVTTGKKTWMHKSYSRSGEYVRFHDLVCWEREWAVDEVTALESVNGPDI